MVLAQPEPRSTESVAFNGSFKVVTWGCQMNVEDSEQMELMLKASGLAEAPDLESADVILLNTCSVRKKPEDKAFSLLGELREVKSRRPNVVIGICGCMAQLRADEIKRRAPHVDFVIGTAQVALVPTLVLEAKQARNFQKRLDLPARKGAVVTSLPERYVGRAGKLKSFVPIQYGCDKFCTFCIVPTTRGRERSRPTMDILREVTELASRGTKEVTLLGQTVNSYGKNMLEGKVPFAKLLRLVAGVPGIERIRYTSPYPRDFTDDLIATHKDVPKVMEHCHLPLQSGDNEVLKHMKRLYTVESYTDIYNRLRSIPGMSVTTDIIVGFPGETDDQFLNTMKVVETLRFDSAFMFAYSQRPGTPAANWDEQVPTEVKKRRLNELIALQNEITLAINMKQAGTTFEVLVEGVSEKDPTLLKGYTRHNKVVHFPGNRALAGNLVFVETTEGHPWGFFGQVVSR
jgi:tRNA-2-methylthio-N6-dimethylallyladenosine synthase